MYSFERLRSELCYHGATVITSLSELKARVSLNGTVWFELPLIWEHGALYVNDCDRKKLM